MKGRKTRGNSDYKVKHYFSLSLCLSFTDVVPTPPDGPPTIAAVTGRGVTLNWNAPKWLDSAIGRQGQEGKRDAKGNFHSQILLF